MSKKGVLADKMYDAIRSVFYEYGDKARNVAYLTIADVAKEAAAILKQTSPVAKSHGGKYAANWKARISKGRLEDTATVYNEKQYRLTHLLENGWVDPRDGKRKGQRVHIKPVETWAVHEVYAQLIERLEGIR